MKIGILTAGGDCPGLNAAIRGVGKTAILEYGMEVVGIPNGFLGLINNEVIPLKEEDLSGILTLGGTILGTSRVKPFKKTGDDSIQNNKPELIKKHYKELGLDCLVCIGGNGTQKTANLLSQEGLNIIGIPKTIDNDVWGTDMTFGFDSALTIATEAIDRLHTTSNSHGRIMVIETMGHNAGWLTLYSGLAGGGDVILIPEIPYKEKVIGDYLLNRAIKKKGYSIVVVSEGIDCPPKIGAAKYISTIIKGITGLECRETILGYTQRGGSPSPMDRILASRLGAHAAELIAKKKFGNMVAIENNSLIAVPLAKVGGKLKLVLPENQMIENARKMGICFGDK